MKIPKLNIIFRLFDFCLWPFMWFLGGFVFPVQETHPWHVKKWDWKDADSLFVKGFDKEARFNHSSPLGLFHMPIFGGLTKYVVIEAVGFKEYWNIGWEGHIQILKIKTNRIMLLAGSNGLIAYGLGDGKRKLKLKIVDYGSLGDGKYNEVRLF